MGELELVGLHEDGEHLVLVAPDGARFRLRIDEPLRAAVRRDRPQLEQLRAESAGTLSPREIQARIRAGATTQEVADSAGLPSSASAGTRARCSPSASTSPSRPAARASAADVGAPTLGDLVTDRLAARGVDLASLAWDSARDAVRSVGRPRAVRGRRHRARGALDLRPVQAHRRRRRGRGALAVGDRARPTSPCRAGTSPPSATSSSTSRATARRPHAAATSTPPRARARAGARPAGRRPRPCSTTCAAAAACGRRVELDDDDTEEFEGFGPQHAFDFGRPDADGARRPPARRRPGAGGRRLPGRRRRPVARRRSHSPRTRRPSDERRRAPAAARARSGQGAQLGRDRLRREARVGAASRGSSSSRRSASARRRRRPGGRRGHPAHVVPTAQHLVADLVGTGLDVADDDLRALDDHRPADGAGVVGRAGAAPAQRRTCSTSTRSASSTSRAAPGKSRARKSVEMPNTKTSTPSSSTTRASCSTCSAV